MQAAKNILCVVIAIAVGMAVMPMYAPMDVTKDHNVDLRDAILLARNITESAEDGKSIKLGLGKSIEAFYVVAKLKHVINSVPEEGYSTQQFKILLPSFSLSCFPPASKQIFEFHPKYQSLTIIPEVPPPRDCV
jgi:hypothetical protein